MKLPSRDVLFPLLAFLVPFGVFVRTAAPGATSTDAGELAAVAATLGVAHPTGYPLFTLAGHAWLWLPLGGSPIHGLNLFAGFCVAASALLFLLVRRLLELAFDDAAAPAAGARSWPAPLDIAALAAALTYAFARTVWRQATAVEVYGLHLLLALAVLALFVRAAFAPRQRRRDWVLWAFVLGLSFTNHMTTIVLAPALLFLFVWRARGRSGAWTLLAVMAPPFLAGLCLYAYLPLRSAAAFPFHSLGPPLFDWGGVGRGWRAFLAHVAGRQFHYTMWSFTRVGAVHLRRFLALVPYQLGHVGLLLVPVGLWRLARDRRPLLAALLLLLAGPLAYALGYGIPDIDSYFLLAFVALVCLAAVGGFWLVRAKPGLAFVLLVVPAAALLVNWSACDQSEDYTIPDFVANMASGFEPHALVLSGEWEHFDSAFWYLQQVEGFRRDVALVDMHLLHRTWYGPQLRRWSPEVASSVAEEVRALASEEDKFERGATYDDSLLQRRYVELLRALIDRNIASRPVYVTPTLVREAPDALRDYGRAPAGFAWRLVHKGDPPPPVIDRFDLERFIAAPLDPDDPDARLLASEAADGVAATVRYAQAAGAADVARRLADLQQRLLNKLR